MSRFVSSVSAILTHSSVPVGGYSVTPSLSMTLVLMTDDVSSIISPIRPKQQVCVKECCAADADAAECVRLASSSSVVLLGGPEESIFNFDHVAGPQTTQEQFFRGDQARPVAHMSHPH